MKLSSENQNSDFIENRDDMDIPKLQNKIDDYLKEWNDLTRGNNLERYQLQEQALELLFQKFPKNKTIADVLLKVSALNDFYSTNILDTCTMAKHIFDMQIDSRLEQYDPDLVDDIAHITINGKERCNYSFASKYCSHHQPDYFPIYDSFVVKMLVHYKKADKFSSFTIFDLRIYRKFKKVMEDFREIYELKKFSLKQVDIFLWLVGKKYFPRNKNVRRNKNEKQKI